MHLIKDEDIWDELNIADIIFVCSSPQIKKATGLVMQSGVAKEANEKFSWIANTFADILTRRKDRKFFGTAYAQEVNKGPNAGLFTDIGIFQDRYKEDEAATKHIIIHSSFNLSFWSDKWGRIALECPGVGHGLPLDEAIEGMRQLPDNVFVYYNEKYLPKSKYEDLHSHAT